MAVDEHRVRAGTAGQHHILGRHTIHVLPHATARLNPYAESFCLPANDPNAAVFIPLTFNNSRPASVSYSLTSFDSNDVSTFEVAESKLLSASAKKHKRKAETDDLEDDDWLRPVTAERPVKQLLLEHLPVSHTSPHHFFKIKKPGVVKLVKVQAKQPLLADIPFSRTEEVKVVECPSVRFLDAASRDAHCCIGDTEEFDIALRGVPPFTLEYVRSMPSKKPEALTISGISPPHLDRSGATVDLTLPLNYTFDGPGITSIKLSKVTDAFSNQINAADQAERRIIVHSAPRVTFLSCTEESPVQLLEGGQSNLGLMIDQMSSDEGPYVVSVKKPNGQMQKVNVDKQAASTVAHLSVDEPGKYEVLGIQGKYCKGDVMSPNQVSLRLV